MFLGVGRAQEVYPQSRSESYELCERSSDGGRCVRFQGYIYVGRGAEAEAEPRPAPAGDSSLSERRLYVHAGGVDNR